ncbi:MAG: hypothetical protein P4L22_01755 [Candidatus Babeliales bacterium]|nr:hypothetical protein [Candidatus Babeliales bacterium]
MLLLIFLLLALLTGGLSFSGLLVGSGILILLQILWPIFAILFVISLIQTIFFPGPKV